MPKNSSPRRRVVRENTDLLVRRKIALVGPVLLLRVFKRGYDERRGAFAELLDYFGGVRADMDDVAGPLGRASCAKGRTDWARGGRLAYGISDGPAPVGTDGEVDVEHHYEVGACEEASNVSPDVELTSSFALRLDHGISRKSTSERRESQVHVHKLREKRR